MHHQPGRRAAEHALKQMPHELALGMVFAQGCLVDVGTLGFISFEQALLEHDLHGFEDRRVTGFLLGADLLPNFTHRAGAVLPQDGQDRQLGLGWFWQVLFLHNAIVVPYYTIIFVYVNGEFRTFGQALADGTPPRSVAANQRSHRASSITKSSSAAAKKGRHRK
ncbi:hypothetical protein SBV1_2280006 [Verrucomicrobia bacterium]|nr:hypothetical protein SBV1_2280006 [Verrucomicrobiota bacterium]